jgi:nitrate/nitrite transporter NarK
MASIVAMNLWGHHSDATGERRWHLALPAAIGAAALAASAIPGISGPAGIAALAVAASALMCQFAVFWALPTEILSGAAAAAGIAWINSIGNLAGYASPHAVGFIRDRTHSMLPALLALAGLQVMTAVIAVVVGRKATR